jgi:hypothetical protein
MADRFSVYCDESCHLLNDESDLMVLGAIWCPTPRVRQLLWKMRSLKRSHGLPSSFEIKWTKVSPGLEELYLDLVRLFFAEEALRFRCLVAHGKSTLRHDEFAQTHDDWYYKMYFLLLRQLLAPDASYMVFLDVKDTRSSPKVAKLHEVLCNSAYDFSREIVERIQSIRSHEVELLQLADFLTGAVSYANRTSRQSRAKLRLLEEIRALSGYSLTRSTLLREDKLNIFHWKPQESP